MDVCCAWTRIFCWHCASCLVDPGGRGTPPGGRLPGVCAMTRADQERRGFGSLLLRQVVAEARRLNCDAVYIKAEQSTAPFWRKRGCVPCGQRRVWFSVWWDHRTRWQSLAQHMHETQGSLAVSFSLPRMTPDVWGSIQSSIISRCRTAWGY